jgi:Transposase DDE domain
LIVCGKVNFTNLSRYSPLSERTYRRHYAKPFEFAALNRGVVEMSSGSGAEHLAVMDCSFVGKSGKATFGLDRFWNGCASRVETGLEISVVGVVDVSTGQGYTLSAQQTYASSPPEVTRMDQYLCHFDEVRPCLPPHVRYLAVDGAFAKERFVSRVVAHSVAVISKLRCDANLRYLYSGEQKQRGRPRKYDGKINFADLTRFTLVASVHPQVDLYTAVVWHVSLKREIRVVSLIDRRHPTRLRTCLLFSTDVQQDPMQIYQYYKLRFQIEFIFRDAQQFTGLADCQARDALKLEFHFNASLTALNLAKLEALQQHSADTPFVFSMASVKRRTLNHHLLERFICNLDLEPNQIKSHPNYSILCNYGAIAA